MLKNKALIEQAIILYSELRSSKLVGLKLNVSARTVRYWISRKNLEKNLIPKDFEEPVSVGNPQKNIEILDGVVVVFSDAHILPNEPRSVAALALLKVIKELRPSLVVNGGDTFDFSSVSKHEMLGWSTRFTVKEEIEAGMEFLSDVLKHSPGARHIALQGNHDCRFNKFLANHVPQFKGVNGFNIVDHFPKGWEYNMSIMINRNTVFLHNHHSGIHAAYNNTLKGGLSVVTGHTHILEAKPFTDFSGDRFGIQTGTLATIQDNPLFAYTNGTPLNWQAGFVVLTYKNGKLMYPEICHVSRDGYAIFRGQVI